jgi:hypothetical protein
MVRNRVAKMRWGLRTTDTGLVLLLVALLALVLDINIYIPCNPGLLMAHAGRSARHVY